MSAVTSIANPNIKCNLAKNIQNLIFTANKIINIMWIPSYIGIPGNELADELALKAVRTPNTQIYPYVTYEDVTHALKTKCYSLW